MKNSKLNRGKIGLMENSINDDERKNFAGAIFNGGAIAWDW